MNGESPLNLHSDADRVASDILARGGRAIRYQGEWLVPTNEANAILPYGPRYLQSKRGTDGEMRSISFSAPHSRSKHYWYWIVDVLALARIVGREDYFRKVA